MNPGNSEPDTVIAAWEARDRVIAILRHQLCEFVHDAKTQLIRYKAEHKWGSAYAAGKALEVVLGELGDPGDRSLPKPDGVLPLNPSAEGEAREFLSSAADALLGKCPVH